MSNIQVHCNLADLNMSINNNIVLNYFMENFDFQHFNSHFIKELQCSEISDDQILVYILKEEYGKNIESYKSMQQVSRDIVQQWVQPMTIDRMYKQIEEKMYMSDDNYNVYLNKKCMIQ